MSAHTPGPWVLSTVPTSVGSCHKIGPFPNGSRTATFACVYADCHRLGIDDANPAAVELAANARLIAAAPDLLAACRRAVCAIAAASVHDPIWMDDYEIVSAAIAKATGSAA